MPSIRPSSDLRNKHNEISEFCHKYSEPVYITALVIARRAIGFRERITKELKEPVRVLKEKLVQVCSLPREGRGKTRKAKLRFKRLDEKLLGAQRAHPFPTGAVLFGLA